MEHSASDVWLRLGRGKATLPYLTLPHLLLLELGTRRVGCLSLFLSLLSSDRQPPQGGTRRDYSTIDIYSSTLLGYLGNSVVQKTGYYFFLSFLLPFQIEAENTETESVVMKKTNQPTNQ